MSESRSRSRPVALIVALVLFVPVLLLMAGGAILLLGFSSCSSTSPPQQQPLAAVDLPAQPLSLTWSPDDAYIAGGTWGGVPPHTGGAENRGAVYLINARTNALAATLDLPMYTRVIAFSPDGKWLAVGTCNSVLATEKQSPAEVLVCEVPGLAVKHRAAVSEGATAIHDLAWALDSSALYAVEGVDVMDTGTAVRGWSMPAWKELPIYKREGKGSFNAVAVAPDGRSVVVAEQKETYAAVTLRTYNPLSGKEIKSLQSTTKPLHPRLGFTPDGKSIGIVDGQGVVTWCDRETGESTTPQAPRLALLPAAQSDRSISRAVTEDLSRVAVGVMDRMKFIDLFAAVDKYGSFVEVTDTATSQKWKWRIADEYGSGPAVAFNRDGSKIATSTGHPTGGTVQIWPTPK